MPTAACTAIADCKNQELAVSVGGKELAPCFEEPTAGELVLGGRKLAGSAQYREENSLLQHGSILVDDDQPLVASLARAAVSSPTPYSTPDRTSVVEGKMVQSCE